MLTRAEFLAGLASLPFAAADIGQPAATTSSAEVRLIRVPFDHGRPADGGFDLEYLVARPFDRRLPTIIVLGDGQQFYIRRDLWAAWADRCGEGVNVVGIAGRGFAAGLQARVGTPGDADAWAEAYRLLNHRQWAEDAETVRRDLVGANGRALLNGTSGGGRLVHEYLSIHGDKAAGAFTRAAVFSYLDAEFGLQSDRFWDEIGQGDRAALAALIARHPERRVDYVKLLQRQNFFVPHTAIGAARSQFIADLAAGREDVIARRRNEYQVDAIDRLLAGPLGAAIRVRLFEFFAPVAARSRLNDPVVRPDLEVSAAIAAPLLPLWREGRIEAPRINIAALHRVPGEVLMLAGRRDHTADYRTQIALCSSYPRRKLLLVDDNHNFARLGELNVGRQMMEAWRAGLDSPQMAALEQRLEPLIWREQ